METIDELIHMELFEYKLSQKKGNCKEELIKIHFEFYMTTEP